MSAREQSQRLQAALRELLMNAEATTQNDLVDALAAQGFAVNQTKISRVLRQLNATKSRNESNQIVYRLPKEPAPPAASAPLAQLVLSIQHNEAQIIVITSPGAAQLIARLMDYHREELGVIGLIAGDDTIFVAPASVADIATSVEKIKALLT